MNCAGCLHQHQVPPEGARATYPMGGVWEADMLLRCSTILSECGRQTCGSAPLFGHLSMALVYCRWSLVTLMQSAASP
jgi:hypothetical protein